MILIGISEKTKGKCDKKNKKVLVIYIYIYIYNLLDLKTFISLENLGIRNL